MPSRSPAYRRSVELRLVTPDGEPRERRSHPHRHLRPCPVRADAQERALRPLPPRRSRAAMSPRSPAPSAPTRGRCSPSTSPPTRAVSPPSTTSGPLKLFEETSIPGTEPAGLHGDGAPVRLCGVLRCLRSVPTRTTCARRTGSCTASRSTPWRGKRRRPRPTTSQTRSEVREIDDFGRVLTVLHEQRPLPRRRRPLRLYDLRGADWSERRVLVGAFIACESCDCRAPDLPTYATRVLGVRQPARRQRLGRLPHLVHPRAPRDGRRGAPRARSVTFDATFDAAGNPISMTSHPRGRRDRTRSRSSFDPFGLAPVHATAHARPAHRRDTKITLDPVTLEPAALD